MNDEESKAEGKAWLKIANQNSVTTNKSSDRDSSLMTDEFRMNVDAHARRLSMQKRARSNSNMPSDQNQSV